MKDYREFLDLKYTSVVNKSNQLISDCFRHRCNTEDSFSDSESIDKGALYKDEEKLGSEDNSGRDDEKEIQRLESTLSKLFLVYSLNSCFNGLSSNRETSQEVMKAKAIL